MDKLKIKPEDRWIYCGNDVRTFLKENTQIQNKRFLLRTYSGIALLLI